VFHGHKDAAKSCSFCASEQRALTASFDQTVKIWDLNEGTLLYTYEGHDMHVSQARPDNTGDR
jgi:WD40 repeat protein